MRNDVETGNTSSNQDSDSHAPSRLRHSCAPDRYTCWYSLTITSVHVHVYCMYADNPNPSREVVTIKLNERVQMEGGGGEGGKGGGGGGEGRKVLIETVFVMNGMWRKLQFKRQVA